MDDPSYDPLKVEASTSKSRSKSAPSASPKVSKKDKKKEKERKIDEGQAKVRPSNRQTRREIQTPPPATHAPLNDTESACLRRNNLSISSTPLAGVGAAHRREAEPRVMGGVSVELVSGASLAHHDEARSALVGANVLHFLASVTIRRLLIAHVSLQAVTVTPVTSTVPP